LFFGFFWVSHHSPFSLTVKIIHYPKFENQEGFDAVKKPGGGYGGVFSVILKDPTKAPLFYDNLNICKVVFPFTFLLSILIFDHLPRNHYPLCNRDLALGPISPSAARLPFWHTMASWTTSVSSVLWQISSESLWDWSPTSSSRQPSSRPLIPSDPLSAIQANKTQATFGGPKNRKRVQFFDVKKNSTCLPSHHLFLLLLLRGAMSKELLRGKWRGVVRWWQGLCFFFPLLPFLSFPFLFSPGPCQQLISSLTKPMLRTM